MNGALLKMANTQFSKLLNELLAAPGFPSSSGMRVVHAEIGRIALALNRRADLLQHTGSFHAGVIVALADQAAGAAATSAFAEGRVGVTIEIKMNFLKPADGDEIVAQAEVMQAGGTIGAVKVEVISRKGADEKTCAFGTATIRSVEPPRQPS